MSKITKTRRPKRELLEELGQAIRAEYINQRRTWASIGSGREVKYKPASRWDEGYKSPGGKRTEPIWPRVAQFLLDNQIHNYPRFIQAIFEQQGRRRPPPQPNYLHGEKALAVWRKVALRVDDRVQIMEDWAMEKQAFAQAVIKERYFDPEATERDLLQGVIADDTVALSPLYRYCVATGEGLPRHAKFYAETALRQYVVARDLYDEVWGGWIPEHLKKEAQAMCPALPEENDGAKAR